MRNGYGMFRQSAPRKSHNGERYDVTSANLQELGDQSIRKRSKYDAGFKARGAIEVVKGKRTVSDFGAAYGAFPTIICQWKKSYSGGVLSEYTIYAALLRKIDIMVSKPAVIIS